MDTQTIQSYLPLEPAAASVGVPKTYLRRLADNREVPFLDVNGRKLFYPPAVVDALHKLSCKSKAAR